MNISFWSIGLNLYHIAQTTKYQLLKEAVSNWKRKSTNSQLYMYYLDEMAIKKSGYDKIAQKWDKNFNEIMSVAISDMKINQITPKIAIEKTQKYPVTSLLKIASLFLQLHFKESAVKLTGLPIFA